MEACSECYVFTYEGQRYSIDVENMRVSKIDRRAKEAVCVPSAEAKGVRTKDKEGEPSVTSLCLFLTQACNLRCVYCYGDREGLKSMTKETALYAVDWFMKESQKQRNLAISFFGGEPLLEFPLMKEIVRYAKERACQEQKRVDFHVTTNATLLEPHVVEFVVKEGLSVTVSFDGGKKIQDSQRPYLNGDGSYDTTVGKIQKLLEVLPQTPCNAVLLEDTCPNEVKKELLGLGFQTMSIKPASQSLFQKQSASSQRTEHLIRALEESVPLWRSAIFHRDKEALQQLKREDALGLVLRLFFQEAKNLFHCGAGRNLVALSPEGEIYPCHRFIGQEEFRMGTIYQGLSIPLTNESPIWKNKTCSLCFARYYCACGCMHDNLSSEGNLYQSPEDMCRYRRREVELAAVIKADLSLEDSLFLIHQDIFSPKPCLFDF